MLTTIRRFVVPFVAVAGAALVAAGIVTYNVGQDGREAALAELREEKIILSQDDENAPEERVDTAEEAIEQAEQIEKHTLERTGGKRYAELDREDPAREQWVKATTLRTALFSAATALEVTRLVTYLGYLLIGLGSLTLTVGVPVVRRAVRQ